MSVWTRVNSRNPINKNNSNVAVSSSAGVRSSETAKESGPYKVVKVVNIPGGEKPRNFFEETGIHLVGIDPQGREVRVQTKMSPEEAYAQIGMSASSYEGRLFKINKEGEAEFIDKSGTANILGEALDPPPNVVASSMPISIMGITGMNFPGIGELMALGRKE